MSAAFRTPDTMVATAAQSRVRTPGTSRKWSGNDKGTAGVGVFVAEEWIEKVFEVQRVSNRIIIEKLVVGQHVVIFLSVYAPQSGLSDQVKDLFFNQLHAVTARIPASEFLIPCGDWNGHIGRAGTGYRGHSGYREVHYEIWGVAGRNQMLSMREP